MAFDCLNHEVQRVKANGSFSNSKQTSLCISQGSVLRPLLFKTYINDLFYAVKGTEICNYAEDATIFACSSDLGSVLESLTLSLRFENSYMKMNEDKSHLLVFGNKDDEVNFKNQVHNFCKKASKKLHALARASRYTDKLRLELTMTSFVMSHLNYFRLLCGCFTQRKYFQF